MKIKWHCPVCGYDLTQQLDPARADENATVYDTGFVFYTEICPSCGIEFGMMGDFGSKEYYEHDKKFYISWREEWIQNGMKWGWSMRWNKAIDDPNYPMPPNWNPREQLKNIPKEFLGPDEKY